MERLEIASKSPNAKFFIRILPVLDFAHDSIKLESNKKVLRIKCVQNSINFKKREKQHYWRFFADDIFWNKNQEEIYESVCGDLVEKVVNGISGLIVSYGQSGSGKTFTTSGLRHHYDDRGILLRLLSSFCSERFNCRDFKKINISMSYVEFSRTEMKDLLTNRFFDKFKDVCRIEVLDEIDAWKSIFHAEVKKSFDHNAPYAGSHRCHTVFTFHVESTSLVESHSVCTHAKVHLVDMAGIESGNSSTAWKTASDIGYSNLSKTLMEQLILCISGKIWKSPECVCPFKTTKLLDYLRGTLQPHCLLRFVGHIIGSERNLSLTLSTLRFGEKVRGVRSTHFEREVSQGDPLFIIRALEIEVERLRAELDLKDMLSDSPNYSNLSQDKLQQIRRAATNFLIGNLDKLMLLNLGQAEITLDIFREMFEKCTREKEEAVKEAVLAAIGEIQLLQLPPDKKINSGKPKTGRKRTSRQQEQQQVLSEDQRFKSSESNMTSVRTSATTSAQVGQLDKKGLAIGIGTSSTSFESPLTKALKKIRSKKCDTIVRPGSKSTFHDRLPPPLKDLSPDFPIDLPEKVPSREEAWQDFSSERNDLIQGYHEEISKLEENVQVSRKNYMLALCELGRARDALEKTKKDLEDCKHIQYIKYSPRGGEEDEENCGKLYAERIYKREMEIEQAAEYCHVALIDLRNSLEELAGMKATLENEFQMFCTETYKIPVIPEENPQELQFGSPRESNSELEAMDHIRLEMYSQFRQKILNYVPKRKKMKWVPRF